MDQEEGFSETVKRSWQSQSLSQSGLMGKISQCRKSISAWKRMAKPNSALRIQELHHKIDEATKSITINSEMLSSLRSELNDEYHSEEIFWMQKSRLQWLRSGDRNTKFFHAVTKNRRAQNKILSLVNNEGQEWYAKKIWEDWLRLTLGIYIPPRIL